MDAAREQNSVVAVGQQMATRRFGGGPSCYVAGGVERRFRFQRHLEALRLSLVIDMAASRTQQK
jgi:hypothetical protein